MNTHCKIPLLIAAALVLFPTVAQAVLIKIRISGVEEPAPTDEIQPRKLSVSNGLSVFEFTRTESGHSERECHYSDWGTNEETGQPEWQTFTGVECYDLWTMYEYEAPDLWLGQSICFTLDNEHWSSLFLVLGDPNSIQTDVASIGGNPYANAATDPLHNVTTQGNTIAIGQFWNDASQSVFTLNAWDNALPGWPCVGMELNAAVANAYWRWNRPGAIVMELDYLHRLTLRGRTYASKRIVLDPDFSRILIDNVPVVTATNAATQLASQFVARTDSRASLGSGAVLRTAQPAGQQIGQLVLGKYNDDTSDSISGNHRDGVLIVGTGMGGTGTAARTNGLRILDNGTVLIWPAGDLKMDFKDGPTP